MRFASLALALVLATAAAHAGSPKLQSLRVAWDRYPIPVGSSNAVVVIYKSTSLGTAWSPFKATALAPATRTNTTVAVLPGLYRFYATARAQPYGESDPSNVCTNRVNP